MKAYRSQAICRTGKDSGRSVLRISACMILFILSVLISACALADVLISATTFPDDSFRDYVSDTCDTDHDGVLTDHEIANTTSISVNGMWIGSLKGIEYFTHLEALYCHCNQLTELNISSNTALKQLWCEGNYITDLDVSSCPVLCSYVNDYPRSEADSSYSYDDRMIYYSYWTGVDGADLNVDSEVSVKAGDYISEQNIISRFLDPNDDTETITNEIAARGISYFPESIRNQLPAAYTEIGGIYTYLLDNVSEDTTRIVMNYLFDIEYSEDTAVFLAYGIPTGNGGTEWVLSIGYGITAETGLSEGSVNTILDESIIRKIRGKETTMVVISEPSRQPLNALILPASLTVIESEAFSGISAQAILIPKGCTKIESRAFANCPNLISAIVPEETEISEDAFDGCGYVHIDRY